MRVSIEAGGGVETKGVLRLREAMRQGNRLAPLRMTELRALKMTVWMALLFMIGGRASATTYYVSSSAGNDANNGTATSTPWQTVAKVNGQTFVAGDSILFKRGDIWNEGLVPPSSGSSGNPIIFDAYGTGAAPNLTGYYGVPATAWVLVTGNAWKAPVPASYTAINFCLFGSIWGQKVAAVSSNLTAQWDFYLANGYVYVYSQGNPAIYYGGPIVPMALSNVPVIGVNGQSWLTFQHFLVNWFDQYGVYVQGASDHLVFANMESDSMIPEGTQPLGFYVNESAPGPGDIKIYNSEANLNYDGFRFDGGATAIKMVNDKAYANRDGALVDNTGAVTYSYCHFYASSLAVAGSTDVEWTSGTGPTAGAGNIAADTAPAVQAYQRYPAEVTLTVDDAGMTAGADTYYASTVLPIADAASIPVGAAITVGYPLAGTLVSEFQGWVNAGRDVTSHSMSHTYYTNTDALDIQYTGSGTAAALSISGKTLTITVTGASDSVSYNLGQGQAQGTILGLKQALAATGKFTTSYLTPCQGPYGTGCSAYTAQALLAQDLADVSGQDVKTSIFHLQLDVTRLTTDEITLSRQWMTANLTGLPATPVYVYPGGYETTTMQGITANVPYAGARGALKEDLGVNDTYADGFNVQNITSFGVNPSWQGLTAASLNQKIQALVWKESVWGVPWGIFWHLNELSSTEITNLIEDFKGSGATIQTNTGLVNWLLGGTKETGTDGNYYYKRPATSMALDFRPTKNSPVVDAGQNLGAAYALDINGVNQNSYGSGWEIGAHVYEGYAVYGTSEAGSYFTVGGGAANCGPPLYACAYTGQAIVQWPTVPNLGGLVKNGAIVSDASYPGGTPSKISRCTDTAITASTSPNLSKSAGLGGSGDAMQMWNANSTMLHFNNGGGAGFLTLFNPATMVCGDPVTGYAITADKNLSNPGSSSVAYGFGQGSFDWSNPGVWYTIGKNADASTYTQVVEYTLNPANGNFTVGPLLADFAYGLPLGSNIAAWQPSTSYATGQYVSYTLTGAEAPDWQAGYSGYNVGDIIVPLTNNPSGCAFKLSTAGTTGTTEPMWGSPCRNPAFGPIEDGGAVWRPIGGPAVFTYQLTSAGASSGTSTPAFVPASTGHPDLMTTVSDNGLTWTNTGPEIVPAWNSFAGVSRDGTRFCTGTSTNSYGYNGSYTYYAEQGSGTYAVCYDSTANVYQLLNTATGIQSTGTCLGGTGYNCSGGTWSMSAAGTASAIAGGGCGFFIHNMKGSATLDYPIVAIQALIGSGSSCGSAVWQPFLGFNSATSVQLVSSLNHWTVGYNHMVNVGQSGSTFGYSTGAYDEIFDLTQPGNLAATLISWQPNCDTAWFPNDPLPPCQFGLAYDSHMSWANNPGNLDVTPICGTLYNLATLSPVETAPGQGEEVCISTSPAWANGSAAGALQKEWRFTHTFATGTNALFDDQFQISQLSNDGKWLAFGSDWGGMLGNTSGGSTALFGYPWLPNNAYAVGATVNPFSSTGGSGTNYGVFDVTVGGTSAATHPTWFVCNSGTAGNTVTDANGVQYTCEGAGNARGDVFIVQMAPSS